jgi:hypothetical protein
MDVVEKDVITFVRLGDVREPFYDGSCMLYNRT